MEHTLNTEQCLMRLPLFNSITCAEIHHVVAAAFEVLGVSPVPSLKMVMDLYGHAL